MEMAVEGRREDSVAVDYYLFLLLSKTLRSVVTIEMFCLTRRFCDVNEHLWRGVLCLPA